MVGEGQGEAEVTLPGRKKCVSEFFWYDSC